MPGSRCCSSARARRWVAKARPANSAAALGDFGTSRLALTARDREILLACAAGAGLGAVYSVPLGGALFAAQILLGTWHPACGGHGVDHLEPRGRRRRTGHPPRAPAGTGRTRRLSYLFAFLALAIAPLAVAIGLAFDRVMAVARPKSQYHSWMLMPAIAAAGLLIGICSIWWPELPGNGRSILTVASTASMTLGAAGVILLLKPLLTALFLRAGAVGGLLTPALGHRRRDGIGCHACRSTTWPACTSHVAAVALDVCGGRAGDHPARAAVRGVVRVGAGASAVSGCWSCSRSPRSRRTACVCCANATSRG